MASNWRELPSVVDFTQDVCGDGYGAYGNAFFAKHIELNEGPNDAKEVQPYFIHLSAGMATYPYGMNDQRVVVGAYYNEDGVVHGFVATPTF